MSVRRAQSEVSSAEFGEWIAYYAMEARANDPDREPTTDELSAKFAAFADQHRGR